MPAPLFKVLYTDNGFPDVERERKIVGDAGGAIVVAQCKTEDEVLGPGVDADGLLVQWAKITPRVIEGLRRCRVIVRMGIGLDNVDLAAAKARGIAVCNVPDYCIDEVADHTVALALALARQLPMVDARLRAGTWKITPDRPMPAFREMLFATAGLGRIARAVLQRARGFGFRLGAFDPLVPAEAFEREGAERLSVEELFAKADVLSLHVPLTDGTRRFVNGERLARMKPTAILVNTARGPLIETPALAHALSEGRLGGAGLDVFDPEPLPPEDPIRRCPNAILTSHVAWYSERSVPRLQTLSAEEVVRGALGQPLRNRAV